MIRIENLSKAYGERVLLDHVSLHFTESEKIALVGANGAGKTTLLNILCGIEDHDGGQIIVPSGALIGYLPQEPNPRPAPTVLQECQKGADKIARLKQTMADAVEQMERDPTEAAIRRYEQAEAAFRLAGGYGIEARAQAILTGLGFREAMLGQSPLELSGGWRMRLELAKIFLKDPDFLILDEPTNHLDLPSLAWVERYLASFRGTLVFVSHDRALLNRLATVTLHLHKGALTPYRGNFDAFMRTRAERIEQEQAALQSLQRKREQMERFVERFGAKATKATQAQSRVKMIARLRELESGLSSGDDQEASVVFHLPEPPKSGEQVLTLDGLAIGYENHVLATGINLTVTRGSRVAIIGSNGIGKSTLLKTVEGRLPRRGGSVEPGHNVLTGYFAQDQLDTLDSSATILANVLSASPKVGEREARSLLGAFLFQGDDVFKAVRVLSGGEKSRVGLARLLVQEANFLLLDEPTNHLDMTSVEALTVALDEYQGTILFISHDREFIDAIATHIFVMLPDGRSQLFEGKLDDYERLAARSGFPNVLAYDSNQPSQGSDATPGAAAAAPSEEKRQLNESRETAKELKRERQRLEKLLAKLEADQSTHQDKIQHVETALAAVSPSDYVKLGELNEALRVAHDGLRAAEEGWLETSARLEEVDDELKQLGRA